MRVGQNPAKSIDNVPQPAKVTIAVVTYIPYLSGYYKDALDVLKISLESIWANTKTPYDLMVFDNASCEVVREYLVEAHNQERLQYLILSDKNIGKAGAWNLIFSGAPGEIIAFGDSDIYYYPGWLSTLLKVLDLFPEAGMVTGMPMWSPDEFSTSTIKWSEDNPEVRLEHGKLLTWEDYWRHSCSLGTPIEKAREHFASCQDYRIEYTGETFFVAAGHFQFVARKQILQCVLPIPSKRPMGQVRLLDIVLNERGYLRLSTP
ncbi:glycosyltransferase family A protein, partial [Chloroflexota bacterium]